MNEIEFRRRAISNPEQLNVAELSLTPAQQAFLKQRRQSDQRLRDALEVEIPDGLEQRILLRHSFNQAPPSQAESIPCKRRLAVQQWAMAASLLLAVFSGWWLFPTTEALEPGLISHVEEELRHLHITEPGAADKLKPLLAAFGGHWQNQVLPVNYAGACSIRGKYGLHVVTQGEKGPVTVLILPNESVSVSRDFVDRRFDGRLIPTSGGGMALIGEKGEDLERLERRLRKALVWQS